MHTEYTEALEQEVSLLKAQCRNLKEQLEGAAGQPSAVPAAERPAENLPPAGSDKMRQQQQRLQQGVLLLHHFLFSSEAPLSLKKNS